LKRVKGEPASRSGNRLLNLTKLVALVRTRTGPNRGVLGFFGAFTHPSLSIPYDRAFSLVIPPEKAYPRAIVVEQRTRAMRATTSHVRRQQPDAHDGSRRLAEIGSLLTDFIDPISSRRESISSGTPEAHRSGRPPQSRVCELSDLEVPKLEPRSKSRTGSDGE
jgi:hypothetical protein